MILVKKCIENILKISPEDIIVFEKHHRAKKDIPRKTGCKKNILKTITIKKYIKLTNGCISSSYTSDCHSVTYMNSILSPALTIYLLAPISSANPFTLYVQPLVGP